MSSYQVVCSVIRPQAPTQLCHISDFQDKVQQHISSVFHDVHLDNSSTTNNEHNNLEVPFAGRERSVADQVRQDSQSSNLCALVSKTKACFSGEDKFHSDVKLPFFWCNFCPYSTESKPSLLQHLATQHCFHCRHCSYVALTRSDVVQHGLQEHFEFKRQIREQKLRGYHLLQNVFQQNFSPQPAPDTHPTRKRSTASNDDGEADPSKQPRVVEFDGAGCNNADNENDDPCFDCNSSSSNSCEASLFAGPRKQSGSSAHSSASTDHQLGRSESLSENIVSSSSMEVDATEGAVLRHALVDEPGSKIVPSEKVGELSTVESLATTQNSMHPSVTIKQEVMSEDKAGFGEAGTAGCRQEGTESEVNSPGQSDGNTLHHSIHPCEAVTVKIEPGIEEDSAFQHVEHGSQSVHMTASFHRDQVSHDPETSSSREPHPASSVSPPLSSIHVENLQRQFEESVRSINLSLHDNDQISRSAAISTNILHRPSAVRSSHSTRQLSAAIKGRGQEGQSKTSTGQTTSPKTVDNFLLDPSADSHTEERTTLLRDLLTRAHDGKRCETNPEENPEPAGRADDHFLFDASKHSVDTQTQYSKEAAEVDTEMQIKQEPEDEGFPDSYMSSSDNMRATGESHEAHNGVPVQERREDVHADGPAEDASFKTRSESILSSDSDLSLKDILRRHHRQPAVAQTSSDSLSTSRARSREEPSTFGKTILSPIEKLKSMSNMTLRDILMMKTPLGLGLENAGTSDNVDVTEVSMDDEDGGEVVWECGFCDYAASEKEEVAAHRDRWHGDQMMQSPMSAFSRYRADSDDEREACSSRSPGAERRHWFMHASSSSSPGRHYVSGLYTQKMQRNHHREHSAFAAVSKAASRPKVRKIYEDYDYHYQSSPLSVKSSSESETERDDPDDRNYIPPTYLMDKHSSGSGSGSDSQGHKRTRSGLPRKYRHRGKRRSIKPHGEDKLKDTSRSGSKIAHVHPGTTLGDNNSGFFNPSYRYRCRYCDCQPTTLSLMKKHLKSWSDPAREHLLVAEMVNYPHSVLLVCPEDSCYYVTVSEKAFLEHVLLCQGAVLDASEESSRKQIFKAHDKLKTCGEGAGYVTCPVDLCQYSKLDADSLQTHFKAHIDKFHSSQMVLFHTVCTAMAKVFSTSTAGQFVCYLCGLCLSSVKAARCHAEDEHRGQMRGVLHILKAESPIEKSSCGLLVALTCLQCQQRIPFVNQWYKHTCSDTSASESYSGGALLPWTAWPWKLPELPAGEVALTPSEDGDSSAKNQLPLVRSILMDKMGILSDKRNLTSAAGQGVVGASKMLKPQRNSLSETPESVKSSSPVLSQRLKTGEQAEESPVSLSAPRGNDDDDLVTLMLCEMCQDTVPETEWKRHECFEHTVRKSGVGVRTRGSLKRNVAQATDGHGDRPEDSKKRNASSDSSTVSKSAAKSYPLLLQSLGLAPSQNSSAASTAVKTNSVSAGTTSTSTADQSGRSKPHTIQPVSEGRSPACVSTGNPSLRSLLVGPPVKEVAKKRQGAPSILKDTLLGQGEAIVFTVKPSRGSSQQQQNAPVSVSGNSNGPTGSRSQSAVSGLSQSGSGASGGLAMSSCQTSVAGREPQREKSSPADLSRGIGEGESSDMVNWLHQQGSQMMRVLGDAISQEKADL